MKLRGRWGHIGGYVLPMVIALACVGLYVGVLLAGPGLGFPLDDAWIHLVYARNLARYGELAFQPGEPSTGATSLLWLVLLAAGLRLGAPPVAWSLFLGSAVLLALIGIVVAAGRHLFADDRPALLWAVLTALSGHMLWFSLSGMETLLPLALGMGALLAYVRGRTLPAGGLLALLVSTRPEGAVLPGVLVVAEAWRMWRGRRWDVRRAIGLFLPPLLALGLVVGINMAAGGDPLPTSYVGRRWIAGLSIGPISLGERLAEARPFLAFWFLYLSRWSTAGDVIGWLWPEAVMPATIAGAVLLIVALGGIVAGLRRDGMVRRDEVPGVPLAVLLLGWALAHDLLTALFMPAVVHAGRYQAITYLVLTLGLSGSAWALRVRWPRWSVGLSGMLLALALAQILHWSSIYRAGVEQINSVHVVTARWVATNVPPDEPVAAFDIGALGFLSERPVVDLSGLTRPELMAELLQGDGWSYLRAQGVHYLARIEAAPDEPGKFAQGMGFVPRPDLPVEKLFNAHYPLELFWPQYLATMNASPSITVYRLP